jgi:hypothetical protein
VKCDQCGIVFCRFPKVVIVAWLTEAFIECAVGVGPGSATKLPDDHGEQDRMNAPCELGVIRGGGASWGWQTVRKKDG